MKQEVNNHLVILTPYKIIEGSRPTTTPVTPLVQFCHIFHLQDWIFSHFLTVSFKSKNRAPVQIHYLTPPFKNEIELTFSLKMSLEN